ncbi:neutral zinc metallopeptidase [Pseudonocardia acidicola]|uniref:Metalloprotease-like protein n=1 Tax=Pseudonocardia acidicola TaxID=2724939 RepID=A0ABX1SDS1_9PSEU|nr:metalloprotease-like protein [Pseudonocardia acidicola]
MRAAAGTGPRGALTALLTALLVLLGGCTQALPGQPAATSAAAPQPGDPPLSARSTDDIVTLTIAALQDYWRTAFPARFGRPWTDIRTFTPVRPGDPAATAPPCVRRAADLADQAVYCPAADAVVWDAEGLLPSLRDRFGPPGVVVVLAHEIGHAVQTRLGVDDAQRRDPARHPTILLETMADCYAGAALRHLVDDTAAGTSTLPVRPAGRDSALLALVDFRDPPGTRSADRSAHGNAFDRVSAFQDGYADGPTRCAAMALDNREFTQRRFGSAADRARGGNLPPDRLLRAVGGDARTWFGDVVRQRVPGWRAPELLTGPARTACDPAALGAQGPAGFCAADGAVLADRARLSPLQQQFGDFAGATLIASRYGLAAQRALGSPTEGPVAGRGAVCLAGAYTGRLIDPTGSFGLSPGDLDEAVEVLLATDWASRDARGQADPAEFGYERVQRFRAGLLGGAAACG